MRIGLNIVRRASVAMSMTVATQLDSIHTMAQKRQMQWLKWIFAVLSVALFAVGLYKQHFSYFMFMAIAALFAYLAYSTAPHIRRASEAHRLNNRTDGNVTIEVDNSSDSVSYYATVTLGSQSWRFEFIPLGWKPVAGETRATFYLLPSLAWPALVEVGAGILYPRDTPKQMPW